MFINMNMRNQQGISTFWGVSIILMEAVAVFFVFYFLYFFWIENPTPTEYIAVIRPFNRTAVQLPVSAETSTWLKYQNVTFGFSLQYPADYKISEDEIIYGDNTGHIFSLTRQGQETFWLRIFPAQADESITEAYKRLTNVNPSTYQLFPRKIGGVEAIAYRVAPGRKPQDHLVFIGNRYFFEAPLDNNTAPILSTFKFIQ